MKLKVLTEEEKKKRIMDFIKDLEKQNILFKFDGFNSNEIVIPLSNFRFKRAGEK